MLKRLVLMLVAAVAVLPPVAAADYTNLQPGATADLQETLPVQIVLVGFQPGDVPEAGLLAGLPAGADPVVRSRLWYGVVEQLGLHYTFDYSVTYTDAAWEDSFFGALAALSTPGANTAYQDAYNDNASNVLDVSDNHFIDAPSVEHWLAGHAPAGVDTTRNTVFLINWWGRPDFEHHVYTKTGEPDPDTGYDFGMNRDSRKIIGWGGTPANDEETGDGTTSRVWFFDPSAGPEAWGGSYDVDNADLDGDGVDDYRIPPIWEYGHYRAASELTGDLSKVVRYVSLNLHFAPSPIYPPGLGAPRLPLTVNLDRNTYEGWPGVDATAQYEKPALLVSEVQEVEPVPVTTDSQDLALTGRARSCLEAWSAGTLCYPSLDYPPDANLFVYNARKINRLLDRGQGYEAPLVNYSTPPDLDTLGLLGFADDNWVDGTQSFVFSFINEGVVDSGYGLTTTEIHEYGHHSMFSHPHDGWDSASGVDYEPTGDFFFAWAGDEVNSMMSYIDVNWDFSQFDRDNGSKFKAAAYVSNANAVAAMIAESRKAKLAADDLAEADSLIGDVKAHVAAHEYGDAAAAAVDAYAAVLHGAQRAHVQVRSSGNGWILNKEPVETDRYAHPGKRRGTIDGGSTLNGHRAMP